MGPLSSPSITTSTLTLPSGSVVDIGRVFGTDMERTIVVDAGGGGDATTIKDAVTQAASLVPPPGPGTAAVRIIVTPGTYNEDNPIAINTGYVISGLGGITDGRVYCINAGQPALIMAGNCLVERISFWGCDTCVESSSGTPFVADCYAVACGIGCYAHGTSVMQISRFPVVNATVAGYIAEGTADINVNAGSVTSTGAPTPYGILVDGGRIDANATRMLNCASCVHVVNGGTASCNSLVLERCQSAFHMGDACDLTIGSTIIDDDPSWTSHIYATGPTGTVRGSGSTMTSELISIGAGVDQNLFYITRPGGIGSASVVTGNLSVGTRNVPTQSFFGGGQSYLSCMRVLTNTNLEAGTWNDITSAVADPATVATLFAGTGVDNCLYIGCTEGVFYATAVLNNTAISGGELEFSYWNGAAWTTFTIMILETYMPYRNLGYVPFSGGSGTRHVISFGRMPGWSLVSLNGTPMFPIRVRITSAITTIPAVDQIRLLPSTSVFTTDGFRALSGNARIWKPISWHVNLAKPGLSSPTDQDVRISDTLEIGLTENVFSGLAATVDRIGFAAGLPLDIDTSLPIVLELDWFPLADGGGATMKWIVRWGYSGPGDQLYTAAAPTPAPNEQEDSQVILVGSDRVQTSTTFALNVERFPVRVSDSNLATYTLWLCIERNAGDGSDTFTNSVALLSFTASYGSWCSGATFL